MWVERDSESVNAQDPASGATALHIAIVRQHTELVELITSQPMCDPWLRDRFGQAAPDMLIYTADTRIFEAVVGRAYPRWEGIDP